MIEIILNTFLLNKIPKNYVLFISKYRDKVLLINEERYTVLKNWFVFVILLKPV